MGEMLAVFGLCLVIIFLIMGISLIIKGIIYRQGKDGAVGFLLILLAFQLVVLFSPGLIPLVIRFIDIF